MYVQRGWSICYVGFWLDFQCIRSLTRFIGKRFFLLCIEFVGGLKSCIEFTALYLTDFTGAFGCLRL